MSCTTKLAYTIYGYGFYTSLLDVKCGNVDVGVRVGIKVGRYYDKDYEDWVDRWECIWE